MRRLKCESKTLPEKPALYEIELIISNAEWKQLMEIKGLKNTIKSWNNESRKMLRCKCKKKIGGETMKVIQLSTIVINGIVEIEIRLYIN